MPPRKPPPGSDPSQAAWLKHMGIIEDNPMRKPKAPSPQQKAAQTRAKNRARVRSAAAQPPNYTPGVIEPPQASGSGRGGRGGRGGRVPMGSNLPQGPLGKNLPVPYKPPAPPANIPKPSSGSAARGILGRLGAIGTAFVVADTMKNAGIATGMSKPQNVIVGPAEAKAARQYGAQFVSNVKAGKPGTSTSPASPTPRGAKPNATPSQKISKMSDYGAGPKGKTGKFLRKAYYTNRLYAMQENKYGDVGAVSTPEARSFAMKEFKRTHKWARNVKTAEQKRNLAAAVTYLQKSGHKNYWTP